MTASRSPNWTADRHGEQETARIWRGVEYVSCTEFLRRTWPHAQVVATELDTAKDTALRLGQMAASMARSWNSLVVPLPTKLHHSAYPDGVNGWPMQHWARAWSRFASRYHVEFWPLPEMIGGPKANRPSAIPIEAYRDQRLKNLADDLTKIQIGETPGEALLRRTAILAKMFQVEKEYTT